MIIQKLIQDNKQMILETLTKPSNEYICLWASSTSYPYEQKIISYFSYSFSLNPILSGTNLSDSNPKEIVGFWKTELDSFIKELYRDGKIKSMKSLKYEVLYNDLYKTARLTNAKLEPTNYTSSNYNRRNTNTIAVFIKLDI